MNLISRIQNKLKSALIQAHVPYHHIIGRHNFIIMYHGVTSNDSNPFNSRHAYVDDFERQIRYLSKRCNILSVKDFFEQKFDSKKCNIALTFDDGFKNNLQYAAPILKKYKVPASFYITGLDDTENKYVWADFYQIVLTNTDKNIVLAGETFIKKEGRYHSEKNGESLLDFIKNDQPEYSVKTELFDQLQEDFIACKDETKEYWKLMNKEDIQKLSNEYPLITIGSHGFYHNNLGNVDVTNAESEMRNSKDYLESIIQKEVTEIGYPDGSYSDEVKNLAESIGFKHQLATDYFRSPTDASDQRMRGRRGIYQIGSWSSQLNFKF